MRKLWGGSSYVFCVFDSSRKACTRLMAGRLALAALVMAAGAVPATARVHASILVEAGTGTVLEAHNADTLTYPASLTKLMTLYITFQQLSSGKMMLRERLRVSSHAARQSPTKLWLRPGERISVQSAILAITTRSANDAAVVLAEAVAGSEWRFAHLMNEQARELGLKHTTFRNASGLPNRRQKTTARDMATLALAILHDYPEYYHFFKAQSFIFRGRRIYGHDHLLGRCPGVDGMKTGYTTASGFNIVTSAVRHNRRLVGVVMGGRSARSRDRLMIALLNRGFSRFRTRARTAAVKEKKGPERAAARYRKVSDEDAEPLPEAGSGWLVQIGGNFRTSHQVRRALRSARRTAPKHLEDARPLVVKLRGRRYRARFSEIDEETARDTCRALRRRKFTCTVLHTRSGGMTLASAGR